MDPGLQHWRRLTAVAAPGLASLLVLILGMAPLAVAGRAAAGEIPPQDATPLQVTRPDEPVPERTFGQAGEVQWFRVDLRNGRDYAFSGVHVSEEAGPLPRLTLLNAAGSQLLSFELTEDSTDIVGGSEFRAPATATFYIKAENTGTVAPLSYFIAVERDCREGSTTSCVLPVARSRGGSFNFTGDSDWHRIAAQAGKRYTVRMSVDISGALTVRNRGGNVIGTCSATCQIKFKAAYTGPYFVIAGQEDENSGSYRLRLTAP